MTTRATAGAAAGLAALTILLGACASDADTSSGAKATGTGDEPAWTLLDDTPTTGLLEPGPYALTAYTSVHSLAVVQAPEGFLNYGGWTFVSSDEDPGQPFHAMGYMTTDVVFKDPCGSKNRPNDNTIYYPGESVSDLAGAFVAQKGAIASDPAPVTIDGHGGLYVDYRVPDIDIKTCDHAEWDMFPGWRLSASGERAGIWILDVDGQRVLLGWVATKGVTSQQIQEMTDMVTSTKFIDPR